MFVSDNVAQSSFFLVLLLFLSPIEYDSCLHFILFSPDDFILGLWNVNALDITRSTYLWARLCGCMGVCGHEKAQHLEERYNLAGYKPTFSICSSEESKYLHMPMVHITATNLVLPAHWQARPIHGTKALVDTNLSMGLHLFITADVLALLCLLRTIISFSSRNKLNYTFLCSRRN